MYVYHVAVIDDRTDVAVLLRTLGEGKEAIELGEERGVLLYGSYISCQSRDETVEDLCLEAEDAFLRTHNLVLVLLEFLGDVTLGLGQCLLANPVGRHLVLVRVAHLEVVAKHVVVANLQALDACRLYLALLHLQQVTLALICYLAQLVELCIHAIHDDTTVCNQQGAVGTHFASYPVAYLGTKIELLSYLAKRAVFAALAYLLDGFNCLQGHSQLHDVAWGDTSGADLRYDALEVAYCLELLQDSVSRVGIAEEVLDDIMPLANLDRVFQGEQHPAMQHAGAHRSDCLVDDVEERYAALVHAAHEFEVPDGELVKTNEAVFLDATQSRDVSEQLVLRHLHVLQDDAGCHDAALEVLHAKTLQVLHLEVAQQFLPRGLFREGPIIELEGDVTCAEAALEHHPFATLVEDFLRGERCHEARDVLRRAFRHEELAGADVEERHATSLLAEVYRAEEVVFLVIEHRVGHRHTRRHEFCDASLDECLRQFRVFELVANGNPLACPDELRQVSIEGVIGEAGHRGALHDTRLSVVPMGKRDAKNLRSNHRIVGIRLIEVAATEQQQRLRVFRLEVVELFHHRCQLLTLSSTIDLRFLCHSLNPFCCLQNYTLFII